MARGGCSRTRVDLGFRVGAGEGNRTLMTSLEGWGSAIELRPRVRRGDQIPRQVSTDSVPARVPSAETPRHATVNRRDGAAGTSGRR